jgi:glycosyltransferase involved in cell wall biosynthesis
LRVLVIPLGEASREEVEAAVRRHFGSVSAVLLNRREIGTRPLHTIGWLRRRRFDAAVLVAPNLSQARLRLTSLLVALPRAGKRWRIDLHGNLESFSLAGHVVRHGWPIVRHAIACVLAVVLTEPLLRLLDAVICERRPPKWMKAQRLLYLRSQLWLGLEGGGSVAHTAGVIGGLTRSGVDVQVVSSDHLTGVQAPTHVVHPETWFDGSWREVEDLAYNVAFFVAALRTARKTSPHVIYQRHTAFNVAGALLSRVLKRPLVLEFNSSEVWKGRYWGRLRSVRAAQLVERINLRAADTVVVVSDVLRAQLVEAGIQPAKILVNPNGVDAEQFHPDVDGVGVRDTLGIAPADVVVGFSGTFGEWHGIPTLAEALPLVLSARPQARWLLIGHGPLRPLVERAIQRHGLHERVVLAGLVRHAEMPAHLAACDVLVSPHGRQADGGEFFGSPTKLYEYMASGRPIVASAVGQIAEVLRDGESALLVPPDDPHALCEAIVRLVDDAQLRMKLSSHARAAAVDKHTWRQNAQRLLGTLSNPDRAVLPQS